MKKKLAIAMVLLMLVSSVPAQRERRLSSAPQSFRTFFSTFLRTVGRSDKIAVARMTQFPFKYAYDAGDEGTMTKSQFLKKFNEVFGNRPRDFMLEKNPRYSRGDGTSYVVSTEYASHIVFEKVGGTYKFAAYLVEP